ncbi:MAG: FAD-binding protein [candidate division Zixibacteria bacterium]|nr:FAD-binding protein [candidate division Zixibacteria bacterium]
MSLLTDLTGQEGFFHDETIYRGTPSAVLIAETKDDLITAVRFCHRHKIPITTRGAGTGLSGGCVPSEGALVVSTVKLNSLIIDPKRKIAFCGPGVITKTLQDEAARYGLTYPPDPASYEESTLGGNVAENAGGLRCKRFGVTKDYVLGLEAITADGTLLKTGLYNDNRGFLLGDLLVASEGTLAVITEIAVRLIPLPGRGATLLVTFDAPEKAAQTVADIISEGIIPGVLEYIDGDAAACAVAYEKTEGIDEKAAAILLMETSDIDKERQTSQIRRFCEKNGCLYLQIESDPERVDSLWRVRRNISNATKAIAKAKISEDVAVPISQFPHLVAFVSEMNRQSPLRINSYGHAGDGNLHVNILSLGTDPEETAQIDKLVDLLLKKALQLGGTISGEHGIGLAKREYLKYEFDPATLEAMCSVKSIFDPNDILNPKKMFPVKN